MARKKFHISTAIEALLCMATFAAIGVILALGM